MRTVEWQHVDFDFEEETQSTDAENSGDKERMSEENDKQAYQLRKYQDPSKDIKRQEILILTEYFGILLANNNTERIAIDLLTDDFEAFIFSSTGRTPVQHYSSPQGFIDLSHRRSIIERRVRVTEVDTDKSTAWQICEYNIMYEDDCTPVVEVACEIFTIKDKRISKYRASHGYPAPNLSEFEKFLMPTRKDKMLKKVKEINYALAGQPDLEKLASLFHDTTEYRIWRWNDHKCFTLYKDDFSRGFADIEEEMSVTSVVPYELLIDTQQKFVSGTYVYHLEERCSGNKFMWFSTCIYGFDLDVNLTRISQQGELYPEEEADIPFELHSRESLTQKATEFIKTWDQEYDAFYGDTVLFDCRFYGFMPQAIPNPGYYQGLKNFDKLEFLMNSFQIVKFDSIKITDVYVDHYSESHEVLLLLGYTEIQHKNIEKEEACMGISIFYFKNGKVTKELDFASMIPSPILSPFDDKTFQAKYIR